MKKKLVVVSLASLMLSAPGLAANFKIKDIRVEGLQRITPDTVFDYLPIKVGEEFTSTEGEQIIKSLYTTGFFDDIHVEAQNDQVLLTVVERPIVDRITIVGGKVISNQLIQQNLARLGVGESKVYNPARLKMVLQGLQQEYVKFGKNSAKITPQITPLERNRVALKLVIEEGVTTKVRAIEFEGNKSFSSGTLRHHLTISKHNLLSFLNKDDIYSPEKAEETQKALIQFYRDRGFYDFSLKGIEQIVKPESLGKLTLRITLDEGRRYLWGKVQVAGDSKDVPLEKLQKIADHHNDGVIIKRSKWYNQSQLDRIVAKIKEELGKKGYAKAEVDVQPARSEDGYINFTLTINPHQKVYVRHINIVGNTKTKDEVIRREFRQQENAPYDSSRIQRSKDRLGGLTYIEDTQIQEQPVENSDDQIDLGVKVKEGNAGMFNFKVGYVQDDGVVISGDFKHDNLWGTGQQVALSLSTGGTTKSLNFDFMNPYATKHGVGVGFDFSANKFDPNDIETSSYKQKTFTGGVKVSIPVTDKDNLNVHLGAEHRRIDLYERSPIYYKQYIQKHGRSSNIFPLSFTWRRSTVDSYLWPTRGYILDTQGEVTLPHISDHQYYKFTHQQWWFFPVTDNVTLMLMGQAGYINNYGKSKDVPFFYNFHTGGMGSVRGFDSSSLGPKINNWYGDVDYIGGTRLLTTTAELFFPMPGLKNSKTVRLSLFADAGSLWDGKTRGPIDNFEYPEHYKSSFKNELRSSIGIGAVWFSPLGALRFSWAKLLKKKPSDRQQSFQFNIGNTF